MVLALFSILFFFIITLEASESAAPNRATDSLEFVYPLLFGAGVRYEHLLTDHFALGARATAGLEFFAVSASGDTGLTYYIDGSFNGFYGQLGLGYLYAYFPGSGSDEEGTKKGPMLAFDLGWKSSGSGFNVRPDIGVKLSSDAVIPTLEFGFGGNLGGSGQNIPPPQMSKNINSTEIGLNA